MRAQPGQNSGINGAWRAFDPSCLSLPVTGWSIWYAGGRRVDSDDMSWADAPATGVQVVVFRGETGPTYVDAFDAYSHPDYPEHEKLGQWIPWEEYLAISEAARSSM